MRARPVCDFCRAANELLAAEPVRAYHGAQASASATPSVGPAWKRNLQTHLASLGLLERQQPRNDDGLEVDSSARSVAPGRWRRPRCHREARLSAIPPTVLMPRALGRAERRSSQALAARIRTSNLPRVRAFHTSANESRRLFVLSRPLGLCTS